MDGSVTVFHQRKSYDTAYSGQEQPLSGCATDKNRLCTISTHHVTFHGQNSALNKGNTRKIPRETKDLHIMASDGRITESVRRMMLLYLILITAIDNVMMKSGLRFYTFRTIPCSAPLFILSTVIQNGG